MDSEETRVIIFMDSEEIRVIIFMDSDAVGPGRFHPLSLGAKEKG